MPRLFAIGDLHLSFARPKPMEVFGAHWAGHAARIERAWRAAVAADDVVLVAGDVSWATKPAAAAPDLDYLAALPGAKVVVKGNHDYWWPDGAAKARALERPGLHLLGNDPVRISDVAVAGTRLWDFPECSWPAPDGVAEPASGASAPDRAPGAAVAARSGAPDPAAMRAREMGRLRDRLARLDPAAPVRVALVHYPPLGADGAPTPLTAVMDEFAIDWCVFGHVHGVYATPPPGTRRRIKRTEYVLASVDQIGFAPVRLC